jgi:hypothetical protein
MSGRIGRRCNNMCRENGNLADEVDGHPVPNDQVTSSEVCLYKAVVMPDGRTVVAAPWYEGVMAGDGTAGQAIDTTRVTDRTPTFVLQRGCIHHRMILMFAENAGINFPPGNEVEEATDSKGDDA